MNGITFFTYIFAALVGFPAIMLIVIVIRHKASTNKRLLIAVRNFMICTFIIDGLYFYMQYCIFREQSYGMGFLFRIMDISAFIGQVYFWSGYIREKSLIVSSMQQKMKNVSLRVVLFCLILSVVNYGFLLDGYYFAAPGIVRTAALFMEVAVSILLTSVTIGHLIMGMKDTVHRQLRLFIAGISLLIIANGIWNGMAVSQMICGVYGFQSGSVILWDPTALFILMINLLTGVLVYKEDFSPMFYAEKSGTPLMQDVKSRLDSIAQSRVLTEREREVMELAYKGLTNPEIAEVLYISKYTVKRHMHNIFEKLEISTRIELIHRVDQENGPPGPLQNPS